MGVFAKAFNNVRLFCRYDTDTAEEGDEKRKTEYTEKEVKR